MDDLKLLDDLVRDDPLPSRSDVMRSRAALLDAMAATAVSAGRRTRLAVRAVAGTAAAAAVLAVVVLGRPGAPAQAPTVAGPPSAGVASTAAAEVPVPARFRLVVDSSESTQATARRLEHELDAALRTAALGVRWITVPGQYTEAGPRIKGWDAGKAEPGGQLFNGGGAVQLGDRRGSLALLVESDAALLTCVPAEADCAVSNGPGGVKVVQLTLTTPGMPTTGDPHVQIQARVGLPDGRVLIIAHSNDIGPDGTPESQWRAPLLLDQITAIATGIAARIAA
jgi:hypothetical protein